MILEALVAPRFTDKVLRGSRRPPQIEIPIVLYLYHYH
jgi:hypothetical protein